MLKNKDYAAELPLPVGEGWGEGVPLYYVEYKMTDTVAQLSLHETRLLFGGVVHFDNAAKVCDDGLKLLKTAPKAITIDMQQLQSSHSVVVAILVSWTRAASKSQQRLSFANMPEKLRAMISVSGLTEALPEAI